LVDQAVKQLDSAAAARPAWSFNLRGGWEQLGMEATTEILGALQQSSEREFFVWIDPAETSIWHHVALVGAFVGGPVISSPVDGPQGLPFIANPAGDTLAQSLSPFHSNVVRNYRVEWNLETVRFQEFKQLPSRLQALFLFGKRSDAELYKSIHPEHVQKRILKRGQSEGQCGYSVQDSAWIDFMRLPHAMDNETIWSVGRAYWRGVKADTCNLTSMGKPWRAQSCPEVLFYGTLVSLTRHLQQIDGALAFLWERSRAMDRPRRRRSGQIK
jgi:hypothetical protein